mgnify:CR=1 FL=1
MSATDTRAVVQQLVAAQAVWKQAAPGMWTSYDEEALAAGRALLSALPSEQRPDSVVWCGCGDGITPNSGSICGNCAAQCTDSVHPASGDLLPLDTVRIGWKEWKLVPVEPTEEMWKAADAIDDRMFAGGSSHGAETGQIWEAMLAAAPALPLGAVSVPAETASGARPQDETKQLTDEQIDAVARELFCKEMGEKEGDWGPNTLNAIWLADIGRPFARAVERAHGFTGGSSNE